MQNMDTLGMIFGIFFVYIVGFLKGLQEKQKRPYFKGEVIMIDLDGVLNQYFGDSKYSIPKIEEGAQDFLKKLSDDGYNLILFTSRDTTEAKRWLKKNKIDKYFNCVTNTKYPASIYLDDRAIQFKGNYEKAYLEIKKFQPHWTVDC